MTPKIHSTIIAVAVLVIIAAGIMILMETDSQKADQSVLSDTDVKTTLPGLVTTVSRSSAVNASDEAVSRVREKDPDPDHTPANSTATDSSRKKSMTECILVPVNGVHSQDTIGFTYSDGTVFTAESAGNYSSPARKKDPEITSEEAEDIALKALPDYSPDSAEVKNFGGNRWHFDLHKGNLQVALGDLYPDGGMMMYGITPMAMAEQERANPPTTMENAQATAENEIRKQNGEPALRLTDSSFRNNNYVFKYNRIISDVPCARDSIDIGIDSGTGKVSAYTKYWFTPEDAVATQTVPAVSREAATALVEREAKACYPDSAGSYRIVSADLRWMDLYNHDELTPNPGVIPLAWQVRFDDDTIRKWEFPHPEEAWVDAQNGTLLSMAYFHCRSNCG
jgi:hypothetical protein